jgi:UDP-N-acetylglucosamine 3-dehydrogenase
MSPIRIGILGAGAMGTAHAAAYAGIANVEIVGVFSRNPERARAVASIAKARPFTDPLALMEAVDAIDICLPSANHHEVAVPALNAGKHVFSESPLALELTQARQMVEAARRANRLLQVGLLMRSVNAYEHVKIAATSGDHGRLLSLTTWRLGSYLHADGLDHKAHYGDPSTELMTFDFDVARWLMGAPHRLSASAFHGPQGGPGEISALLSYDDGRHATVIASGLMPPGSPFTVGFRALFERAVFEHLTVFEAIPPRSSLTIVEGRTARRPVALPGRNPYQVELQRFVDCIRGDADPALLDGERAVEALVLSLATQRSLAERQAVVIS